MNPFKWLALKLYPPLNAELINLRTLNADLSHQTQTLRSGHTIDQDQWRDIQRIIKEHTAMQEEQGKVMFYLRGLFPDEMDGVYHKGKTPGDIVMWYLKRLDGRVEVNRGKAN